MSGANNQSEQYGQRAQGQAEAGHKTPQGGDFHPGESRRGSAPNAITQVGDVQKNDFWSEM